VIVNLNQYRKKRRRAEADRRAADNRVRFGRSKEERSRDLRESERTKKEIDANVSINADDIGAGRTLSRFLTELIAVGVKQNYKPPAIAVPRDPSPTVVTAMWAAVSCGKPQNASRQQKMRHREIPANGRCRCMSDSSFPEFVAPRRNPFCQIGQPCAMTCEAGRRTRRRAEPLPADIALVFGIRP
jgi:hypothetical protein